MVSGPSAVRSTAFRGDVEGLRAIAVGLVLLYHAGLPFLPGGYAGVDVFFVISGFLITSQLISEVERTGRVSLPRFYARRAKRLLPAAGVVLAVTAALTYLFLPRIRWQEIGGDIASAALYLVNWRLADRSVDYLAEDSEASPVQHFWSLAVEEQYYLVWPLVIVAVTLIARAVRIPLRRALFVSLAAIVVASFVWSVLATSHSPAQAYFVTTTRVWELGVGAGVALAARRLARMPRLAAAALGWAGLAAIVASGVWFTSATMWPGYAATLPTLGTAAVIAGGFAGQRGGPGLLIDNRPMRWIGGLSYSLYLWHWPLIVVAAEYADGLSVPAGLAVAALSVVPAWLTHRLVENPLRYSTVVSHSPRLALSMGANFTLAGLAAGLVLALTVSLAVSSHRPGTHPSAPGAAVLSGDVRYDPDGQAVDTVEWMTPAPVQATDDVPALYADGCQQNLADADVLTCEYGASQVTTAAHNAPTVAVVGDSKVAQWMPALEVIAERNGWRLMTYTKSNCGFHTAVPPFDDGRYTACVEWNQQVLARLKADPPDYVITSQRSAKAFESDGEVTTEAMIRGMRSAWSALTSRGTEIVVIADTPHPGFNVYECVEEHLDHLTACAYDRDRYHTDSAAPVQREAVKGQSGVSFVDMFDLICPSEPCAPIIGNVLIYRQGTHLTATYVETLTPHLAEELARAGLPMRP